ncbi:hypothetical protein VOLCADRAFT_104646 [Volvox carteri f. nagariensis]|uniref:Uncharacterized protein n=1 Tax=Volvox carteri f. nagariensis TaxID=3068 RepID=D8TVI6_VOLCA|nr:uncharacterized protein VOLCADRAFT_104646 [Volvox carteri f. nagariensis]EFJ48465.1 hypothetical protein VOLCADRAFT_104646 [Volvox carteri f. nagariensis]|eukprot:XP_002950264.1 hypothetical protein VOLCADRAFT_104646 [Volvox carteri f. nagariensis]
MAENHAAARGPVQRVSLHDEKELLHLDLQDKDRKVEQLSKSNGQLAAQVQQLQAMIKDAHLRYEDDLQRTVASLQDQYNSALEVLQLGASLAAPSQPQAEPCVPRQPTSAASIGGTAGDGTSGGCTGVHRPSSTRPGPLSQPPLAQQHQQQRSSVPGAACKHHRMTGCRCCPRAGVAVTAACATKPKQQGPIHTTSGLSDLRLSSLGLNVDDLAPSAAYGATVGLVTEPLAVLRDVLNLDGSRDQERELRLMRDRPLSAGAASMASDPAGSLLAQAHFESRVRAPIPAGARAAGGCTQVSVARAGKYAPQYAHPWGTRHEEELRQQAASQAAELAEVARQMEMQEEAWRGELQRLEAALAAAKAAAEASHNQAAAARATVESLQAQLQLQRAAHEAELQHMRQGTMTLEEHEETAEWNQALEQRERDYGALLSELAGLRRQLSSAAEQSHSSGPVAPRVFTLFVALFDSGNSCGRGSTIVSPMAVAVGGPPPPAAVATATAGVHDHLHRQNQPRHANRQLRPHQRERAEVTAPASGTQDVLVVTGNGLQLRWDPATGPSVELSGDNCGGGINRPDSPAGSSAHSASPSLEEEAEGSISLEVAAADNNVGPAVTPRSHTHLGKDTAAAELPPPPPSSSSSRLSALVGAVVSSGSARRGLAMDCAAGCTNPPLPATAGAGPDDPRAAGAGLDAYILGSNNVYGSSSIRNGDGGGSGGAFEMYPQQQRQHEQQLEWGGRGTTGGGSSDLGSSGSQDHHNSEITLGRWQPQSPPTDPCDNAAAAPRASRPKESSWGRSGNPAASVVLPRCVRCGLNDATSPGCCRFHPGLLSQPGSLRFTPEWMTCQAAGHTACTRGCFVRSEHFYELPGLMPRPVEAPQPLQPAAAAPATRRQPGELAPAVPRISPRGRMDWDEVDANGSGDSCRGGGGGGSAPVLRRDDRSGGGAASEAAAQAPAAGGRKTAISAPAGGPVNRCSTVTRSPQRVGARARNASGVGVGGASGGGGSDSPSPKPRTRLPSPMRR